MERHLDTDFLVKALSERGPERDRLLELSEERVRLRMSSVAWYEFCRGPRTPDQIAVARAFFDTDGIIPLSEEIVVEAASVFRSQGSPRRRAADVVIGVTASLMRARLLTRNGRDFAGIPGLDLEVVPGD